MTEIELPLHLLHYFRASLSEFIIAQREELEGAHMYRLNPKEQAQVVSILLTPIVSDKTCEGIRILRNGNTIISNQHYYSRPDPDMSSLAIKFYEVLYESILSGNRILDTDGYLVRRDFAGDTMNSLSTIAKYAQPETARMWENSYHCLANFWMIPMYIGRDSGWTPPEYKFLTKSKKGIDDYMDRFLVFCRDNELEYRRFFPDYFAHFQRFEDFCEKHFLYDAFAHAGDGVTSFSSEQSDSTINAMNICIQKRAEAISQSNRGPALFSLFEKSGLIAKE